MENAILLLEDDEISRELLLKIIYSTLSGYEYNVYIAENGNEALNIIKSHAEKIALFATDIIHPGIEILELIAVARSENSQTKIVLISGSVSVEKDYGKQADYVLTKPFTIEAFAKILNMIFKKKN